MAEIYSTLTPMLIAYNNAITTAERNAISNPLPATVIYNSDDSQIQIWNGSAWIALTNQAPSVIPMLIATQSSGQIVYDVTNSNLFFDGAQVNTDGIYGGGSTNTFTIQTPGVYLVTACNKWSSPINVRADLWIVQSVGGTVARDIRYGTVEFNNVTYTYKFAAGDTLSVWVFQDNSANTSRTANVRLSVMFIGSE